MLPSSLGTDIHSYEPDSDISNLAALAAELGLPALAALDPLVGQSSASRLSHETASAGALQPPSQHLLPPAQHQHSPQVQAPGHSAGSGVAQVPEGSPRTAQLGFVTAGMPAQMMGSTGALGNSASSLETPGPPPALSVGSLRAAPLQGMEYEDHLVTFAFKVGGAGWVNWVCSFASGHLCLQCGCSASRVLRVLGADTPF